VLSVVENQVYSSVNSETTDVKTVVRFESKLGASRRKEAEDGAKRSFFATWGPGSVQRSIEMVGRSRMREGLTRSREGMKIVLEQLRDRGFVGVVKEQRQGSWERWKKVWRGDVDEV